MDARRHELDLSIREILERSERIVGCDLVERLEKLEAKMREEDAVVPVIVEQLRRIRDAAENIGKRLDGHDARLDRIELAAGVGVDLGKHSIARHHEIIDGWPGLRRRVDGIESALDDIMGRERSISTMKQRLDDLEEFRGSILDQREPVSVWGRDVNERLRLVEETAVNASRKATEALEELRSRIDGMLSATLADESERREAVIGAVGAAVRTLRVPRCDHPERWQGELRHLLNVVEQWVYNGEPDETVRDALVHLSATAIQIAAEGRLSR